MENIALILLGAMAGASAVIIYVIANEAKRIRTYGTEDEPRDPRAAL
tara:strand:- start:2459 stop:2599 length:141 start_codon:yes stop_codon:yes gene_type:complete